MNKYQILHQEITNLKAIIAEKIKEIDLEISSKNVKMATSEVNVTDFGMEKAKQIKIYDLLKHYKDIKKKNIIYHVVLFVLQTIMYSIMWAAGSLIASFVFQEALTLLLAVGLPAVAIINALTVTRDYYDNTRNDRITYKENIDNFWEFPRSIMRLGAEINLEKNRIKAYKNEIAVLKDEKKDFEIANQKADEALALLIARMPVVAHICRHNDDAMNEVFDSELELLGAFELIRTKKEKIASKID